MDKLEPCPFCGGEVEAVAQLDNAFWIEHVGRECLVFHDGIWASDFEWNTRTPAKHEAK